MSGDRNERLWKVNDVAEFLQMSVSWVYKQAEGGLIPVRRLGASVRFDPVEVRAFANGEWKPKNTGANVLATRK
jgi:predicted DNA-binding transcriptional regulator AlpA